MQKAEFIPVKIISGKAGKGEYLDIASSLILFWLCVKVSVMPLERQVLLSLYHAIFTSPKMDQEQPPLKITDSRYL